MIKEHILKRFPGYYILALMCLTRLVAFGGAALVVSYVNFTFNLTLYDQRHFEITAVWVIS
jgi:hypothetical protein